LKTSKTIFLSQKSKILILLTKEMHWF